MDDRQEARRNLIQDLEGYTDAPLRGYALVPIETLEKVQSALAETAPVPASAVVVPNTADRLFIQSLLEEIARARRKFPKRDLLLAALGEEYGETVKACLDESTQNVYAEAVQTAAMALRLAIEGDPTLDAWRNSKGLPPLGMPCTYSADVKVGL